MKLEAKHRFSQEEVMPIIGLYYLSDFHSSTENLIKRALSRFNMKKRESLWVRHFLERGDCVENNIASYDLDSKRGEVTFPLNNINVVKNNQISGILDFIFGGDFHNAFVQAVYRKINNNKSYTRLSFVKQGETDNIDQLLEFECADELTVRTIVNGQERFITDRRKQEWSKCALEFAFQSLDTFLENQKGDNPAKFNKINNDKNC